MTRGLFILLAAALTMGTLAPDAGAKTTKDRRGARERNQAAFMAMEQARFRVAAKLFDAAFQKDPDPFLLWNAARAHQQAAQKLAVDAAPEQLELAIEHATLARERFQRLLQFPPRKTKRFRKDALLHDASLEVALVDWRRAVKKAATRMPRRRQAARPAPRFEREFDLQALPQQPDDTLELVGWGTLGLGAASVIASAALFIVAQQGYDSVSDAQSDLGLDGRATKMTRAEALAERSRADDLALAGWISAGVGAGLVIAGAVMVAVGTADDGAVPTAAITDTGAVWGIAGRF